MATTTTIEWTRGDDGTAGVSWNPVRGCTKVSAGCDNCYAEAISTHWNGPGSFEVVRLVPEVLDAPLDWRKPRRVFVNSMSDLFHADVPDEFILEVFTRMWWAPAHTFQVLTKRHARMATLIPTLEAELRRREADLTLVDCPTPLTWPLPNVWLGVSVEDAHWARIRIPSLLRTPAAIRFISAEPLLGPLDLTGWLGTDGLDWVITGGESGPRARPPHPAWFRSLRDQCAAAGVPFFFKQWGQWSPDIDGPGHLVGVLPSGVVLNAPSPDDFAEGSATMRRCRSKHAAGRELDGRTHDDFPATSDHQEPTHAA
ncbi:DUF5131 family protein [Planobispora rosea]|uniref:DUF5131 family protein n=1 Tax=Planobispora rosea TaxID=35762 RepID=UPI00083A9434|nr:phage Gp37/Gp68 family protein [Planobispora rosea]